jgi:hypothetical protein
MDWQSMNLPSNRQARQDSRDVYPKTGTRGRTPRNEDPSLEAGLARTRGPAQRERDNMNKLSNRGARPDGRNPTRGAGVYDTTQNNRPPAAQTREPARRPQRRRGDGSLAPVDADE